MDKKEVLKTLSDFKNLKENWNVYGAKPIPLIVINKAINLVSELNPIPEVFPTGRESIQLEWDNNGIYFEMEIFEDRIDIYNEIEKK